MKNKHLELHKLLTDQKIDIVLITETWLSPGDTLRLPGYDVHRKDRENTDGTTHRGGVLIATHNSITIEHTPQPQTDTIEALTVKTKTTPGFCIGAAYAPPTNRITQADMDQLIHTSNTKYYLIGGDFNGKHQLWNNIKKNANGMVIKKHADTENYQIIHSPTYSYRQPHCAPSNIDIFLTNLPYSSP